MENKKSVSLNVPVSEKAVGEKTVKTLQDCEYLQNRKHGIAADEDKCDPALLAWVRARDIKDEDRNPFALPSDVDIFKKRAAETLARQQEKALLRKLPVHEKTTILFRRRCQLAPIRELREYPEYETQTSRKDKTKWTTVISDGRRKERESIQDYKAKQKEMFMMQYALGVKTEAIQKLKRNSEKALCKIKQAELELEEDVVAFEEFLKLRDQNSVDAVKLAEKETIAKLEKTAEIKKLMSEMMIVKSDISRNQEILNEYRIYRTFLTAVAPSEWKEEQMRKREERRRMKLIEGEDKAILQSLPPLKGDQKSLVRQNSKKLKIVPVTHNVEKPSVAKKKYSIPETHDGHKDVSESDEEPEIYFTDPQDMLNILAYLEEQNLSYILHLQGTEETLEEIHCQLSMTQKKMENQTQVRKKQIEILQAAIEREKEKTQDLKLKSSIFSFGEFRADKQDAMLDLLHKKVKEVYKSCVGDVDCKISTVQMLVSIENKMLEILEGLELLPQDKVKMLKAAREKETRLRLREEELRLKQQHQEERIRVALERATSAAKKWAGRKLMVRSEPPATKKKGQIYMSTKEQEDYLYFFT